MADVVRTFDTYGVDVLGVTETGTRKRYGALFKNKVVAELEKKGLHCMWSMPDPFQRNLGVMLIHRKGVSMKELTVDGSKSGRVLAGELTTWDNALSKEVKTVVMVLCGFSGMTTERAPREAVRNFNMMMGRVVAGLDEKYRGRIVCMGDFNSLADVDSDGMGLINGIVSEESLVSPVLNQGLVDSFRVLHPSMKAVSFGGNRGSYSRIDYMLGGCGLDGVRMCCIPKADVPLSDHALLLGDIGELRSGIVDSDGRRTSIMDLEGWKPVISTDIPWKRFYKKGEPMREKGTGGVLSEDGANMLVDFRKIVDSEAGELGIEPHELLDALSAAFDAAEAGLAEAGGDYEAWAAGGGVDVLQACVDKLVPDFLSVVQGSIQRFVGKADHSERERREHTGMMLRTMGQLQGGLKRMSHVRREML